MDAVPDQTFTGTVYAVEPMIDAAGRSIALRATIPNEDGMLKPGYFARVNLLLESREGVLMMPEAAIMPQGEQAMVLPVVEGKAQTFPSRSARVKRVRSRWWTA